MLRPPVTFIVQPFSIKVPFESAWVRDKHLVKFFAQLAPLARNSERSVQQMSYTTDFLIIMLQCGTRPLIAIHHWNRPIVDVQIWRLTRWTDVSGHTHEKFGISGRNRLTWISRLTGYRSASSQAAVRDLLNMDKQQIQRLLYVQNKRFGRWRNWNRKTFMEGTAPPCGLKVSELKKVANFFS